MCKSRIVISNVYADKYNACKKMNLTLFMKMARLHMNDFVYKYL